MWTNIELAINFLLSIKQPLTVPNVLSAYIEVAGFRSTEDAVVAFEHALDKHPLPLNYEPQGTVYHRPFILEVDHIRRDYWKERLGDAANCTCNEGGNPVLDHCLDVTVDYSVTLDYETTHEQKPRGTRKRE